MCQSIYTLLKVSCFGPLISKCTKHYSSSLYFRKKRDEIRRLFVTKTILISYKGRKKNSEEWRPCSPFRVCEMACLVALWGCVWESFKRIHAIWEEPPEQHDNYMQTHYKSQQNQVNIYVVCDTSFSATSTAIFCYDALRKLITTRFMWKKWSIWFVRFQSKILLLIPQI